MPSHTPQCTPAYNPSRTPIMIPTDTPMSTDTDTQEALTNVLDLVNRYGADFIIEAVADHIPFDSEEEEACRACERRTARLFRELEELDRTQEVTR
jgi:hypothetical protein